MAFKQLAVVALVAGMAAGCQSDPTVGQKATLGTLGGAVGGAAIGSAFGSGSGKVAAIAAGALIGGFLGNQIGAQMDENDRQYYHNANLRSLDTGYRTEWQNPQSGRYGYVEPGPTYVVNNQRCREYTNTIYIDGRPQTASGTACQNRDGTWTPVN